MKPPQPVAEALLFQIGDSVYHKTEPDKMGIVIAINFLPGGFTYAVQWSATNSGTHYQFELSSEKEIS